MKRYLLVAVFGLISLASLPGFCADHLKLNPKLDYGSDRQDGQLITGEHMQEGLVTGKPNYVIFFQEGCFNSKRQARRTVDLYEKYKDRVNFVIVDLDRNPSAYQQKLAHKYYRNYIPHVTILDAHGAVMYDQAGEVEVSRVSGLLDQALQ
jgi:hypothetical protein